MARNKKMDIQVLSSTTKETIKIVNALSNLSEDDISMCINLNIRYCADLFLEKTAYKILNGTDSDYQEALDSLNSCRHISEKVDLYINKVKF